MKEFIGDVEPGFFVFLREDKAEIIQRYKYRVHQGDSMEDAENWLASQNELFLLLAV